MPLERLLSFTKPRFLLCEGPDDKEFFEALIAQRNLPAFQVCHAAQCNPDETGGKNGFVKCFRSKGIEVLAGWRDLRAILIAVDNDADRTSFNTVCDALNQNGYTAPANPNAQGSVGGRPVAIRLVPNAASVGDLESLALPAIHAAWPNAQRCVEQFLQCTGADTWHKASSISKARARAAAVGFNEPDPYKGIGYLFKHGTLSACHPCFDDIAGFLQGFDAMCGI